MPSPASLSRQRLSRLGAWLRRALPLNIEALNVAAGIRAALACALPVLLGELFGISDLSWVAVISFWGCLADMGGAWRTRLLSTGSFTLFAALGAALGGLVGTQPWFAVPLAFCWCFLFSLIRVLGSEAATVGLVTSLALLVPLGLPEAGSIARAEQLGLLTLAGGLWSMLLALAVWRIYPYGPARAAVALCWHKLARFAAALGAVEEDHVLDQGGLDQGGLDQGKFDQGGQRAVSAERWALLARERRRECREAIEAGRRVLLMTRRSRAGISARGQALLTLLSEADQLFAALLGVSELVELSVSGDHRHDQAEAALGHSLGLLSARAETLAGDIRGRFRAVPPQPADDLRALAAPALAADPSYRHGAELTLRAHDIVSSAAEALPALQRLGSPPEAAGDAPLPASPPIRARIIASVRQTARILRANFGMQSLPFRHALRLAMTAAAAVLATALIGSERGYWVTLTAISVLQPYMAQTWRRTLERVAGSVAGGSIAAFIGAFIHQPVSVAILIFPLSIMTLALRGVNYTLYIICLTPAFVLVAELFEGSLGQLDLAALRALDSVIGGALGLAAAFLLWPSWERTRLPDQLARAIRANRDYLDRALAAPTVTVGQPDIETVRREAGLASNNAEASLQRLIGEPVHRDGERIEPAMAMLDGLRRLAGIAATLTLLPAEMMRGAQAAAQLAAVRGWIGGMLSEAATMLRGEPAGTLHAHKPPADEATLLPADLLREELVRARRQVELITRAAERFVEGGTTP